MNFIKMYLEPVSVFLVVALLCSSVDSACWFGGVRGVPPGEALPSTCNYHGWIVDSPASFKSPAPYCEVCTCDSGALGCCGYGWKGGPVGVPGCRRVIDNSTCDHIFVDALEESKPCETTERIPA